MFSAGIWLVAQIYHMDEHYPDALLIWVLGALGLAWAIPSLAQAYLALLLIMMWSFSEIFGFKTVHHSALLLIIVGVIPLAWSKGSRTLVAFGLLAFTLP